MQLFGVEVTQSNLAALFALLAGFIGGLVALYWKMRIFWYDQEQKYLQHVRDVTAAQTATIQSALEAQTKRIEACIHLQPGHPENPGEQKNVSP